VRRKKRSGPPHCTADPRFLDSSSGDRLGVTIKLEEKYATLFNHYNHEGLKFSEVLQLHKLQVLYFVKFLHEFAHCFFQPLFHHVVYGESDDIMMEKAKAQPKTRDVPEKLTWRTPMKPKKLPQQQQQQQQQWRRRRRRRW